MEEWRKDLQDIDKSIGTHNFQVLSRKFRDGTISRQEGLLLISFILKRQALDRYPAAYAMYADVLRKRGLVTSTGYITSAGQALLNK